MTELLSGNVDAMNVENRSAFEGIQNDPRFGTYYEAWDDISAVISLLYDHRNPLFADAVVRRAIAHAIDRQELKRLLHKWPDLPIVDVPFTESQYWKRELPDPLPYDPSLSADLLDQAGWQARDGDGVRQRRGDVFTFPLIVERRYLPAAVYVQHSLARLGIRVEITTLEYSVVMERITASEFDAALGYVWVSPDDPDAGLEVVFGKNSVTGYRNPRVIELVEAALAATTPESLDDIYLEMAPIIQEDQPVTFLTFGTEMYIAHRRVKGLSSPFRANPIWAAGHLWIGDEGGL
jgi:peptide/nickel transport system substrate-binding protein